MATISELTAKIVQFFSASDKAHQIINGADTATVSTEAGNLPTMAKALKDFQDKSVRYDLDQTALSDEEKEQARANLLATRMPVIRAAALGDPNGTPGATATASIIYGVPVGAVKATGVLTLTGNAVADEPVTIGAKTYVWKASVGATANEVLIGATAADSLENLVAAVSGGDGSGVVYGSDTIASTEVTVALGVADTMEVEAIEDGTAGNAIDTTATMANGSWGAATLTGGIDGDTVSVEGSTFKCVTFAPGADEFTSITELDTLVNGVFGVSSTEDGTTISLAATEEGAAGNGLFLELGGANAGTMAVEAFSGGVDAIAAEVPSHAGQLLALGDAAPYSWFISDLVDWHPVPFTTADVLALLSGVEGDPTRIGKEHLPANMEFDFITLGETEEAELPQGTLTRVGNELWMFNDAGVAEPVVGTGTNIENLVPYRRVSGTKLLIPYGETGHESKASPDGTNHYIEIARLKIPAEDVYGGQVLTLKFKTALRMPLGVTAKSFWRSSVVPVSMWDAIPYNSNYNTSSNTYNSHYINGLGSTAEHTVIFHKKTVPVTHDPSTNQMTFGAATTVLNRSYVFAPTPAGQTANHSTIGTTNVHTPYTDLELVWYVLAETDITKYAVLEFELEADMAPPQPTAPSGLIGTIASPTSAQLDWTDNSSNETGFEIWRSAFTGQQYEKIAEVAAGVTTYIDTDYPVTYGTTEYGTGYYKVCAVNGRTKSDFSNEVNVTPA